MNTVQRLKKFWADEKGASLVEYTLLIGLITIAVVALIVSVGTDINALWQRLANVFNTATNS